jgi:hypothetical protein
MPVQINGVAMPGRMANEGVLYSYQRAPIVGRNGAGRVITAGYPSLSWGWTWLMDTEWTYLVTTILGGARDALLTGTTQLYNEDKVLKTISSCIVHRPLCETLRYGVYYNVRLMIDQIVET